MNFNNFDVNKITNSIEKLQNYAIKNDFKGYEYDDLLASPLVNFISFNSLYLKIAGVQIAKRFPINLRKILFVPKLHSTKAFGFFAKGFLYNYKTTNNIDQLKLAEDALNWLITNKSEGYSGFCWGNDFPFASRAGYFPKFMPTIVWSSHIQKAFDLAYEVTKNTKYLDIVLSIAKFVENDLVRQEDKNGFCFAYAPKIVSQVHNSNLLGAIALLRAWKHSKNQTQFDLAQQSINWSISKINADGSWFYGNIPMLHWIDNYHTAYNLDCLCEAYEITEGKIEDFSYIDRTYKFWIDNLFTKDAIPKFYYNKLYPIDIQATAQAIETLSKYTIYDKNALDKSCQTLIWAIDNMQKLNGSFRYRKYKHFDNQLEAIHWGQATMFSAMNHFLYYFKQNNHQYNSKTWIN